MAESSDLLFFDTFSHESSEELNLDLVQFPRPVYVSEVRIIPLGARVQGDFPGGVRLGATNPTQFHIDFFVNDLSKPGASTFETLGSLEYCQNGRIHMDCEGSSEEPRQIPTDGLVLRGWYTTITLAVYGSITKSITDQGSTGGVAGEAAAPPPPVTTPPATLPEPAWTPHTVPVETYPANNFPQETYEAPTYPPEYYNADAPKDPRAYLHTTEGEPHWDRLEDKGRSRERDLSRSREERLRHSPRLRSRSIERARSHDANSPRYSRSRSREREYRSVARDDGYRRDSSRSPGFRDRERPLSRDKDWNRLPYKRDDYRRHRQTSYDRSRGGSYDKRAPSYERRDPSYEKRGASYEKRLSPYEKRTSPSYDKRYMDKRAPSYDRVREKSFDSRSRSPGREDPRKRPRTPPLDLPRRPRTPEEMGASFHPDAAMSPMGSVISDDGVMEYDHNGKPVKSNDDHYHKSFKMRKLTLKGDTHKHNYIDPNIASLKSSDGQSSPGQKSSTPHDSPFPPHEDNASMDIEQFEPILSDEDICDDLDAQFIDLDYDVADDSVVEDLFKCFNPFRTEWQKYTPLNKASVFVSSEPSTSDVMSLTLDELCNLNTDFRKLVENVMDFQKIEEKYTAPKFVELSPDAKEEWVHTCEQLPLLINNITDESDILLRIFSDNDVKDNSRVDFKSVRTFILNFCRIGLNYDLALSQVQATYKIRHIKCGIRLIEALSAHKYSSQVVISLINNNVDIYTRLLELYFKDYMALSIKLMILKAIDACLGSEKAMEHFLTEHICCDFCPASKLDEDKKKIKSEFIDDVPLRNGYQMLIMMLQKNPLSRIKFAINTLINKINIFELMKKLRDTVTKLSVPEEGYVENGRDISELDIELIISSLDEIVNVYRKGSFELSQPRRFLPVSAQFEINKSAVSNVLIEFFQIHKTLETCLFLLTCPITFNYPAITNPIYSILTQLTNCHEGLIYLYDNIKTSELIFRCLLQPFTLQNEEDQLIVLQDYGNCSPLQQLGLEMAFKLQCLYYVNAIFDLQNAPGDNESELINKLLNLYCLGFTSVGKLALANILSMGDNIQCLLNVFEKDIHSKQSDRDMPMKKKSPAKNYAVDLTISTVQFSCDVNFLKKYGRRILNIAKKYDLFEQSISTNLQEVLPYLKPLEKSNIFSYDNICEVVELIKGSIEHVTSAPGDLITCLRILKHLGIPGQETNKPLTAEYSKMEHYELKYKYTILQLYSLDGVTYLISILEKICSYFEQPSLHSATFVSLHGLHIANIVLPCVELLNKMLTYVIQCRNTQFKDLTSIPVILQTYNLMLSYPNMAIGHKMAQKSCREIIETLLAYTQPIAEDATANESIHKTLWTLLCGEIIKYTLTAPYTFIPGLVMLSEILPLPLPIQTKFPLSDNELSNMISNRKLWSAHLHTLSPNITEMIQVICFTICQPVIQILRKVCIQMSDIASNTALCVTRAVLDPIITNMCGEANSMPQLPQPANYNMSRLLNFLAFLTSHASVKCTLLHLIKQSSALQKSEDRYWLIIPIFANILTTSSDLPSHLQCQDFVISIMNSLCDTEITLLLHLDGSNTFVKIENGDDPAEHVKPVMTSEIYLANAIPSKETLVSLINASLEYTSSAHSTMNLTCSVLRSYFLIIEHDFGFNCWKSCMDKHKQSFFQLMTKFVGLGKESFECLNTLLLLVKSLQCPPEDLETAEGLQFTPRASCLTAHEVAELLSWYKNKENHPIIAIEAFLKQEQNVEDLLMGVSQLLVLLRGCEPPATSTAPSVESSAPCAGGVEPLPAQFAGRQMWTLGESHDERLAAGFWLGPVQGQHDDYVAEAEMIPCELSELTRLCLSAGSELSVEAERLLHLPPAPPRPPQEPSMFRTKRLYVPKEKRPYVSPAHGRIGVTPMTSTCPGGAPQRPPMDAFRSRPPNTSRPPSLHVDDFLALEGCGAQPTGPTGYNKMPPINIRGVRGLRSRGITVTDRGRYASSTPPVSAMYRRGRGSWNSSGGGGPVSGEGSPPLPPHFTRPPTQHFQQPMQHGTTQYGGSVGWGGMSRMGRGGRGGLRHGRPFPR